MSDPTAYGPTPSVGTGDFQATVNRDYHTLDYTNSTGSDIAAGSIVLVGTMPMFCPALIANGASGTLVYLTVISVKKDTSVFAQGDAVYWNSSGNPVVGTAGTGAATSSASAYLMGFAIGAAATDASRVLVSLSAAKRTTAIAGSVTADDITGSDSTLTITGKAGAAGSAGGTVPITAGAGHTNGAGGAAGITGGAGAGTGAGGATNLTGGASGDGATGNGGASSVTGGAALSTAGTGGAASVTGGLGTTTGAGGAASVIGGVGGASGAGGAATLRGGASAGAGGTAGAATVDAGAASGGTGAGVSIGATNATSVTIGKASVATSIVGPLTRGIGASTAADGSTNADAVALPSGTAGIYPTTAADDTKGVIIAAADKVTGRVLFIGNGVSNKVLKVYPPAGGTINGAAANAAFSSVSGKGVIIACLDSGANTWLAW